MTFDEALPALIRIAAPKLGAERARRVLVIRDLLGQLRLVVDAAGRDDAALGMLETSLKETLNPWFAGPILSTEAKDEAQRRVASELLSRLGGAWPRRWYDPTDLRGEDGKGEDGNEDELRSLRPDPRWSGVERVLTKQSWLDGEADKPIWKLIEQTPSVISFFSFKGGVGRTTALALTALDLVARGKRVVCIDLDLEAPGLGELLDALPERGLIDLILEHGICGSLPAGVDGSLVEVRPNQLWVMPAHGQLPESDCGMGYIARLGRLDYLTQHEQRQSPVRKALEDVLKKVKAELRPDYILLDSRAGLHDLGGLSLHALAHLDVIVLRDNGQNLRGLEMTLRALTLRRKVETLAIVCGFAPRDDRYRGLLMGELKEKLYGIFRQAGVYGDETPAMEDRREDTSALHHPLVLREHDSLPRAERLNALETTIHESPSLREDMTTMTSALLERLRVERLDVERGQ